MKRLSILFLVIGLSITVQAKSVVTEFTVKAQCGECKERIEEALDVQGVSFAIWDKESKMLTVRYNNKRFSEDDIHKLISDLGYETSKRKANKEAERKLPKCCQPGSVCELDE